MSYVLDQFDALLLLSLLLLLLLFVLQNAHDDVESV